NAYWRDIEFTLQEGEARGWRRVADTGLPSPDDFPEPSPAPPLQSLQYNVKARSIVILTRKDRPG
ncbi:MAG TPA: hypothetical protein VIK48_04740, partial [Candidatus Manganitrophaceae bacterium]